MLPSRKIPYREGIPVKLMESEFDEFVLQHLPKKSYGPSYKIPLFKIFNYILYVFYTGCQWKMIAIEKDKTGKPEIHFTRIFRIFQKWEKHGSFVNIFENSVFKLHEKGLIDVSVLYGDRNITSQTVGDCLVANSGNPQALFDVEGNGNGANQPPRLFSTLPYGTGSRVISGWLPDNSLSFYSPFLKTFILSTFYSQSPKLNLHCFMYILFLWCDCMLLF